MRISINKVLFIPINCSYEIVFTLFKNKLLTFGLNGNLFKRRGYGFKVAIRGKLTTGWVIAQSRKSENLDGKSGVRSLMIIKLNFMFIAFPKINSNCSSVPISPSVLNISLSNCCSPSRPLLHNFSAPILLLRIIKVVIILLNIIRL